ncbi:hypothetical protein pb186bvf_001133 [Paramecium bursaria]
MIDFGKCLNNFNIKSIDGNYQIQKILESKDLNIESYSQQIILFTTNFQKNHQHAFFLNINHMHFKQLEIEFYEPLFLSRYLVYDYRQLIYKDFAIYRQKFIKCLLNQQTKRKKQLNTLVQQQLQNINQYIFLTYTDSFIRFYTKNNFKLIRKLKTQSDSITCIQDQLLIRRQKQIKLYNLASMQKLRFWIYNGEERIFQLSLTNKNQLFLRTYTYENGQKLINLENGQNFPITIDQQITDSQLWYFNNEILNVTILPDLNIEFHLDVTNIDQLSLKAFQEGDTTFVSLKSNDHVHIYKFQQNN